MDAARQRQPAPGVGRLGGDAEQVDQSAQQHSHSRLYQRLFISVVVLKCFFDTLGGQVLGQGAGRRAQQDAVHLLVEVLLGDGVQILYLYRRGAAAAAAQAYAPHLRWHLPVLGQGHLEPVVDFVAAIEMGMVVAVDQAVRNYPDLAAVVVENRQVHLVLVLAGDETALHENDHLAAGGKGWFVCFNAVLLAVPQHILFVSQLLRHPHQVPGQHLRHRQPEHLLIGPVPFLRVLVGDVGVVPLPFGLVEQPGHVLEKGVVLEAQFVVGRPGEVL